MSKTPPKSLPLEDTSGESWPTSWYDSVDSGDSDYLFSRKMKFGMENEPYISTILYTKTNLFCCGLYAYMEDFLMILHMAFLLIQVYLLLLSLL